MSRRWKALILAVVPGLGHLYLGRHWRGLLVFALFALGVNGMFFAWAVEDEAPAWEVRALCECAAMAAWAYSVLHVAYLSKRFETRPSAERKDYHFRRGLAQYLAGAYDAAEQEFATVLRLDPLDADARFHLGMTFKALGERRKAARAFRRCLADDIDAKWKWEVDRELGRLKETG